MRMLMESTVDTRVMWEREARLKNDKKRIVYWRNEKKREITKEQEMHKHMTEYKEEQYDSCMVFYTSLCRYCG